MDLSSPLLEGQKKKTKEEIFPLEGYCERERQPGQGPLRVGEKAFEFREDMYSLSYISLVNPMYKNACETKAEEHEAKIEEVFRALKLNEAEEVLNDETMVGDYTWGELKGKGAMSDKFETEKWYDELTMEE